MRLGLVLGAGGTVGLAYHAGVLRALDESAGIAPGRADLIVGTSAGAVAAAYLRSGWSAEDMYRFALEARRASPILEPQFRDPLTLARRAIGSAYLAGRALARVPAPMLRLPALLDRVFPGGLFDNEEGRRRFAGELPAEWPSEALWLCAYDVDHARRVVVGRCDAGRRPALQDAVQASCAIPGVYAPVRTEGGTLVDGGVWSTTNLDLAAEAGCDLIVGVAPMAFDTAGPLPSAVVQLVRRRPARSLAGEMASARRAGARVLLIRPSAAELQVHGQNLMRLEGLDVVARTAYDAASRMLAGERSRRTLEPLAA